MSLIDQAAANQVSGMLSQLINGVLYRLASEEQTASIGADASESLINEARHLIVNLRAIRNSFENVASGAAPTGDEK